MFPNRLDPRWGSAQEGDALRAGRVAGPLLAGSGRLLTVGVGTISEFHSLRLVDDGSQGRMLVAIPLRAGAASVRRTRNVIVNAVAVLMLMQQLMMMMGVMGMRMMVPAGAVVVVQSVEV